MNDLTLFFFVLKILLLLLLLLHLGFSLVVLRQTQLMLKVVEARISPFIYLFSLLHLLASFFLFLWTIIFL